MNSDLLTEAELNAIRAREQAATEGPWIMDPCSDETIAICHAYGDLHIGILEPRDWDAEAESRRDADADFIIAARTDIPRLLAHIAELESRLEAAESRAANFEAAVEGRK